MLAFRMLWSSETATLNLDILSVRIFCSTFAWTDSQEKLLVQYMEIQSCDSVAAVRYVGTKRSSHLKSKYIIRSVVKSRTSDFRVSSKKSAPDLILLHFRRACSMPSTSPAVHCTHRGEGAFGMFILWSLSWVGSIQCSIFHKKERISGVRPGTQIASQDLPQSIPGASLSTLQGTRAGQTWFWCWAFPHSLRKR